jgi:hypothetical protein
VGFDICVCPPEVENPTSFIIVMCSMSFRMHLMASVFFMARQFVQSQMDNSTVTATQYLVGHQFVHSSQLQTFLSVFFTHLPMAAIMRMLFIVAVSPYTWRKLFLSLISNICFANINLLDEIFVVYSCGI